MIIAVIGSGGREHAIINQIKLSKNIDHIYAIPGNAGIGDVAECVDIGVMDFPKIILFALSKKIDLVVVAPDDPLAGGLVDELEKVGIRAFGPNKAAAIIEASKAFSKAFMKRHNIPTANYEVFSDFVAASEFVKNAKYPLVVKADGLALGKGVLICSSVEEAEIALVSIMCDKVFGSAGREVVIEEFLVGREVTLLIFTDGKCYKCMPTSQDHKRAYDNDEGLNTGGMGAFSPSYVMTDELLKITSNDIIEPTLRGLLTEGRLFKGVLYFGLMITEAGIKVVEYNARFGDPETQVVLPLLKSDFIDIMNSTIDGTLQDTQIEWEDKVSLAVVIASSGYPASVIKGYPITIGDINPQVKLIHCGTKNVGNNIVTNGGRVFCITTVADSMEEARELVYGEIDKVQFTDARYRRDIGLKRN